MSNHHPQPQDRRGLPEFDLTGKVIVVSGGARGLGLTQAEVLVEAGAIVHCIDRLPEPAPEFSVISERAKNTGRKIVYHSVDVRDVPRLNSVIECIANLEGGLHGLIAAAGVQLEVPALEYTAEQADQMLGINVTGVLMTAQAVAKQMIRLNCKGSIVLIGSMSGTIANRGLICPVYNASKAAVVQLARNLGSEWGVHGIRVNSLSPGYIVTQMVEDLFETHPERREQWASQNFLGRLSTPREFRAAAVFLISDGSSFMTGADLIIDGGHSSW